MTITTEIVHVDNNEVDIDKFHVPDFTEYRVVNSDFNIVSGGRETVYQRAEGDPEHPCLVRLGYFPPKNGSNTNISLKISTWVKRSDSVSGVETWLPCTATLATSMPYGGVPDAQDYADLLQNALAWFFLGNVPADVIPTSEVIEPLAFGLTTVTVGP